MQARTISSERVLRLFFISFHTVEKALTDAAEEDRIDFTSLETNAIEGNRSKLDCHQSRALVPWATCDVARINLIILSSPGQLKLLSSNISSIRDLFSPKSLFLLLVPLSILLPSIQTNCRRIVASLQISLLKRRSITRAMSISGGFRYGL